MAKIRLPDIDKITEAAEEAAQQIISPDYQGDPPAEGDQQQQASARPASAQIQRIYALMGQPWGWLDGIEGRY